jgi:hypothetical protein
MRAEIHSRDLSPGTARELWHLAEAAPLSRADEATKSVRVDSFSYRLTITTPQDSQEYTFTESEVSAELRPLIQRLESELTI